MTEKKKTSRKDKKDLADLLDLSELLKRGDFEDKQEKAQISLGTTFCAFIVLSDGPCLIFGGETEPQMKPFDNFIFTCVSKFNMLTSEIMDVLNDFRRDFIRTYTAKDFRSPAALECVYRYLKATMEDQSCPRALAVECLIFDPSANLVICIDFSGEFEIINLGASGSPMVVVGGYNLRFRQAMLKGINMIMRTIAKKTKRLPTSDELEANYNKLAEQLKIPVAGVYRLF